MADTVNMELLGMEKLTSFASSICPIFGVVSSLVGVVREGWKEKKAHPLDKGFQEIHTKLEGISQKNQEYLEDIELTEVRVTYGKYEKNIKQQYKAFNIMVAEVKENPDNAKKAMEEFKKIYEKEEGSNSLGVYYRGVVEIGTVFGKPILKVYQSKFGNDHEKMEKICSHIIHLFYMGLIAHAGYTSIMEDDIDLEQKKWEEMMKEIQEKIEKVLNE